LTQCEADSGPRASPQNRKSVIGQSKPNTSSHIRRIAPLPRPRASAATAPPHRWWDWSHRGTKCYKMSLWKNPVVHAAPAAPPPAPRASPCNHSNFDISANSPKLRKPPPSAWSCRSRQSHSRQQRPRNFRLRPQSQRIALSSALPAALTISKRPARSRRRPFGVPSPCGKNGQEICRFPWDWQLRRPPASPPAAGKRARSRHPARAPAHAHARAQQPPSPLPIHPPLP
jgi:hypothetical protein